MINKLLEPLPGFTRAYRLASRLNTNITSIMFLQGIKSYNPIIFRQFYEASINGIPSKQLKERIKQW